MLRSRPCEARRGPTSRAPRISLAALRSSPTSSGGRFALRTAGTVFLTPPSSSGQVDAYDTDAQLYCRLLRWPNSACQPRLLAMNNLHTHDSFYVDTLNHSGLDAARFADLVGRGHFDVAIIWASL